MTLPSEFSWSQDATGGWASMTNWSPASIPDTSEHTAVFGSAITANRTVTVDENVTVQNIEFDKTQTFYAKFPFAFIISLIVIITIILFLSIKSLKL